MLKDILLKTAELINRDDLIEGLNNKFSNNPQSLQNDIYRLISYYNHTLETLCENYFNLTHTQEIFSNQNKKISFLNFKYEPTKIVKVTKNKKPVFFSEYSKFITTPEANVLYEITYKYLPDRIVNLEENINLPRGITEKIICYGIASEFLASKDNITQSEFWYNKFMFEIFKSKTTKDRKIKQTFIIWKKSFNFIQISNIDLMKN